MGFSTAQTYRFVLLPQAFRIIIPPLTSEFLNIFKNSSVASLIGLMELLAQTKQTAEFSANIFEAFTLATYPELAQTRVYDRDRPKDQLKTQAHEQAMKARTGEPSRKERIKSQLHGLFEQATSMAELEKRLEAEGLTLYQRGKSLGVVERLADGSERRHRLSTLGLAEHYVATQRRFSKEQPQEQEMNQHPHRQGNGEGAFGTHRDPAAMEVVGYEFLTGKLHEAWHGEQEPAKPYTDPVLAKAKHLDRDQGRGGQTRSPSQDKGDDRER
jgi:hypothetical protein